MPGANRSATFSNTARKYTRNDTRGLTGGKNGQRLGFIHLPKAVPPKPKEKAPPQPQKPGRQARMNTLGWLVDSPFDPLGFRSFLLDGHGDVLATSGLVTSRKEARQILRNRTDLLLAEASA